MTLCTDKEWPTGLRASLRSMVEDLAREPILDATTEALSNPVDQPLLRPGSSHRTGHQLLKRSSRGSHHPLLPSLSRREFRLLLPRNRVLRGPLRLSQRWHGLRLRNRRNRHQLRLLCGLSLRGRWQVPLVLHKEHKDPCRLVGPVRKLRYGSSVTGAAKASAARLRQERRSPQVAAAARTAELPRGALHKAHLVVEVRVAARPRALLMEAPRVVALDPQVAAAARTAGTEFCI